MDVMFTNSVCTGLRPVLHETAGAEQTQEIKLSDGMPDVGRVISAWGQCVVRSKEWCMDHIRCGAGMLVWILYAPEDGGETQMMNTWVPFSFRWELPEGTPEGKIRIQCLTRFADARSVSPRKIMIRCGMSALAWAYVPEKITVASAAAAAPGVELLQSKYPVRIRKEAGEKVFQLDEELSLPESAPSPEGIVYCTLEPRIQEMRVLADKFVFRGNGKLHVLYRCRDGQLHGWDFSLPFSQYALLDETYGPEAQGECCFCITGLDTEVQENGGIRVKCGILCQYLICDREMREVVEDAYSLNRELDIQWESVRENVVLDWGRETLYPEQTINTEADIVTDVCFLPDFPATERTGGKAALQYPGTFHILYYGTDRQLHSGNARWQGRWETELESSAKILGIPGQPQVQAVIGNGVVHVSAELPVEMEAWAQQEISMVTGIHGGEPLKQDPSRPSLMLKRAGQASLWEIAKNSGSTVDAICKANGLQEEPVDSRMLLIPVL